jgi:hypothetical protein
MNREPDQSKLTEEGFSTINRIFSSYDNTSDGFEEIFESEVGTGRVFGSGVYDYPQKKDGNVYIEGPEDREYVLKPCFNHSIPRHQTTCGNHMESWVWGEAVRRGDEDLFAPIIASANDYRWVVMEKGYKWDSGDDAGRFTNHTKEMEYKFKQRGWVPADIEVCQIEGRTVAIDYDLTFPLDLHESLYHHSFNRARLYEWGGWSDRTREAAEQWRMFRKQGWQSA